MKKKHLRALTSVENWLKKQNLLNEELEKAFERISLTIKNLPDDEAKEEGGALPPPQEIVDEPNALALYADGGCRGNPGPGAFAYVIQDHGGKVIAEGVEFEAHTTNNKMELGGAIKGLQEIKQSVPQIGKIKVVTDSKYVVEGMKSWVQGWKSRGWKKADGKAPENLELWQELDAIRSTFMDIEWVWVKGHGGHPQNEYCDRKANEAMDEHIR